MAPKHAGKKGAALSDSHKEKLKKGREEGLIVAKYLEALKESSKPGRKRTIASVTKQLAMVEQNIAMGDLPATEHLMLVQKRIDLKAELAAKQEISKLDELEMAFIAVAKSYSERKGITDAAWREVGVPARVLRAAGIK